MFTNNITKNVNGKSDTLQLYFRRYLDKYKQLIAPVCLHGFEQVSGEVS